MWLRHRFNRDTDPMQVRDCASKASRSRPPWRVYQSVLDRSCVQLAGWTRMGRALATGRSPTSTTTATCAATCAALLQPADRRAARTRGTQPPRGSAQEKRFQPVITDEAVFGSTQLKSNLCGWVTAAWPPRRSPSVVAAWHLNTARLPADAAAGTAATPSSPPLLAA